jgi:hypothetical protein
VCTQGSGNNVTLSPYYQYGNLSISGGPTVYIHLTAGTYNINSLLMIGNANLRIDSGPVILNLAGAGGASPVLNLSGGTLTNSTGLADNFQIVYGGTGGTTLNGGAGADGMVYAPNAPATMSGSSDWYGSVISNTFTDNGDAPVHYDTALNKCMMTVGPFQPVNFSWSKFKALAGNRKDARPFPPIPKH